jgi:hypothetical protein
MFGQDFISTLFNHVAKFHMETMQFISAKGSIYQENLMNRINTEEIEICDQHREIMASRQFCCSKHDKLFVDSAKKNR